MLSRRFVPCWAWRPWPVAETGAVAQASEGTVTGTLWAGQAFVQPFTATAAGTVALRLEWDDPSAKLRVDDVIGGRCHDPAIACYRMTVKSTRWYTPPALLLAYANAGVDGTGRWAILQFYRIVSRHSGTTTSKSPSWNCDSAGPRQHWTSQPELYCLN